MLVTYWYKVMLLSVLILLHNDVVKGRSEGFYDNIEPINSTDILDRLLQVPMKLYEYKLDSVLGRTQTGLMSSDVVKVFPEAVEIADTYALPQRDKSKPITVLSNYPLVDKSVIFMHSIAAIQAIQDKYETLAIDVQAFLQKGASEDPMKHFQQNHGSVLFEKTWISSKDLALSRKAAQTRYSLAEIAIQKTMDAGTKRVQRSVYRRDLRQKARIMRHHRLENFTAEVMARIAEIDLVRRKQLDHIKNLTLSQQHNYDVSVLEFEFTDQLSRNNFEVTAMMDLVKYKVGLMKETEDEEHTMTMMQARDKITRQKVLELVDGAFAEFSTLVELVQIDPRTLVWRCSVALLVVIVLTALYESAVVVRNHCIKKMTMGSSECAVKEKPSEQSETLQLMSVEDLIVDDSAAYALRKFCATVTNSRGSLPLATVLISGPSGTGKTVIARTMSHTCDAVCIFVDGNALQSAGDTAGASLRALFENVRSEVSYNKSFRRWLWPFTKNQPTVIIIDDADVLISSRFADGSGNDTSVNVHCCLYVLLEALRRESLHSDVSVLVTTSLSVSMVDPALLDRLVIGHYVSFPCSIVFTSAHSRLPSSCPSFCHRRVDQVINVQLPSVVQRAIFVAKLVRRLLASFIDSETLLFFEACSSELRSGNEDRAAARVSLLQSMRSSNKQHGDVPRSILSYSKDSFNAGECFSDLVFASHEWSLRDLCKFVANVRSEVLGTEQCLLSSFVWIRELSRQMKDMAILNERTLRTVHSRR